MDNRDLGPAFRWAESHRAQLSHIGSTLEFQLIRLHYLALLMASQDPRPALRFAQEAFVSFFPTHMQQVSLLLPNLTLLP